MIVKFVHIPAGESAPASITWYGEVVRIERAGEQTERDAVAQQFSSCTWIGDGPWQIVWLHLPHNQPAFVGFGDDVYGYIMGETGSTVDRL